MNELKGLLAIAKELISAEIPEWVGVNFNVGSNGTILKRQIAQHHGIGIWFLEGHAKIYKDAFGWVSVRWQVYPMREGTEWQVKSTLSFAPATSGSFARRKFDEFMGLSLITGVNEFRMFQGYAKSLLIIPNERKAKEDIDGVIARHGADLLLAKRYWKEQVKNFVKEGGR